MVAAAGFALVFRRMPSAIKKIQNMFLPGGGTMRMWYVAVYVSYTVVCVCSFPRPIATERALAIVSFIS